MRPENVIFVLFMTLTACDCQYHISGVVLDKLTNKPIADVAIGKTDTTDLDNPFNRKQFTEENGEFDISGLAGLCDEIAMYFSKEGYETQKVTFQNNSSDTIFLNPISRQRALTFDNNKNFEVVSLEKFNNYPSSDTDTSACTDWTLNMQEIEQIIKESKPINGSEWHYLFGHFPCAIQGKLIQNSTEYGYSINSGAWFTVSSTDTTLRFGSFKEENNKYFHSTAWTEEEMEGEE